MKCGACGKTGLKKVSMAFVIERGKVVGRRVGDCCAKDGVTIVSSKIAPVVVSNERKDQREVLRPFIDNLTAQLKARRAVQPGIDGDDKLRFEGNIETLENVIALLKSGRA